MPGLTRAATVAIGLFALVSCAGCATTDDDENSSFSWPKFSDFNFFTSPKAPLPGKRVAVLTQDDSLTGHLGAVPGTVSLPPQTQLSEWTTQGGTAGNAPGHLALGGSLATVWTADAGTASSYYSKITTVPIIHQGRVYVLDAGGHVSAYALSGGARAWSVGLSPAGQDERKGFGGGIVAENGRIFAATGFGSVIALDAGTGAKLWEQKLGAPVHTSPTVADGRVYVTDTDGVVLCLSSADGSTLWSYHGVPQQGTGFMTNLGPAVTGDLVVVPFTSGDMVALKVDNGAPQWTDTLNGARSGAGVAALTMPGTPVSDGGAIYAVSRAGRMIATNLKTGERLWSMPLDSAQMPWVAGDAVYAVDVAGRLVAVSRTTGEIRWAVKLPTDAKAWSGPVLAGGRLWLTSSKGLVLGADPSSGQPSLQRDLGQPIYLPPIVADGRMYVLTDKASLIAMQ
jgi:outer membrane protein assembly factor BamB